MRWLLECLQRTVDPGSGAAGPAVQRLGEAMGRVRRRAEYHRHRLDAARRAFDEASRQVRFLEISEEAVVSDLVEAHHRLLRARNELEHHQRRLEEAEKIHGLMRSDRLRLEDGLGAEHRPVYAIELGDEPTRVPGNHVTGDDDDG